MTTLDVGSPIAVGTVFRPSRFDGRTIVGSELRASSPDHRPGPHGFRLVSADRTADTPSALAPGRGHAAKDEPVVKPAGRSRWRTIALLVAVVAIAQGGFLTYWF